MLKARASTKSALDRDDSDDEGERDSDMDASSDDARALPVRAPTKREPVKRRPQAEPARAEGAPKAMEEVSVRRAPSGSLSGVSLRRTRTWRRRWL